MMLHHESAIGSFITLANDDAVSRDTFGNTRQKNRPDVVQKTVSTLHRRPFPGRAGDLLIRKKPGKSFTYRNWPANCLIEKPLLAVFVSPFQCEGWPSLNDAAGAFK